MKRVSLNEINWEENVILIYPNPTTNQISISANQIIQEVNIVDLNGRLVYSESTDNLKTIIQIEGLSSGIYVVHVQTSTETTRKKIVKK